MNSEAYRKLEYIDIAKGIGIILVVLGHAISKDYTATSKTLYCIRYIIYLVHMPVFFIISGYLFERNKDSYVKNGFFKFLKKKSTIYLLPYAFFSCLLFLVGVVVNLLFRESLIADIIHNFGFNNLDFRCFIYSLLTFINHPDNHLWFAYVMFYILIIAFCINKIPVHYTIPVLYVFYILTWYVRLPELAWKIIRYMLIFQIGREIWVLQKNGLYNGKIRLVLSVSTISSVLMIYLEFRNIKLLQAIIKPFAEVFSAILILYLSNVIVFIKRYGVEKVLSFIGKRSYAVYLIHQPYIVPVISLICKNHFSVNCTIIVAFACGLMFPLLLNEFVINKSKVLKILILGGH